MRLTRVIRPLMPKGVEHIAAPIGASHNMIVIRPLMPKGVEHQSNGLQASPSW